MSESIVRKVQPFTIGTRLSVPSGPKCQEFTQSYLQNQGLDKCTLQHNLNSLYLSPSQVCGLAGQVAPMKRSQEHMAAEDQLNPNAAAAAASAVSRSIKKITISGSTDRSEDGVEVGPGRLLTPGSTSGNNNNNNNVTSASEPRLPRIVGVSCENKPKSHFKVLLRKDGGDEFHSSKGNTMVKLNGEKSVQQLLMPGLQKKDPLRTVSFPSVQNEAAGSAQTDCFTQRNSLFTKEALQAEAWIKGKLQDLKDGCNVQRCPLQDWEEASQTLHRDLKDFENTLIQLNQMGEQLICRQNPTSDLVKKQLSQLRDQWQTLKHTAANQTRALGGAKNLLEFNRKADRLEAWIKEKQEEEQSLENVLAGNVDKMQLTRRILDLKQDEQLYRNLHEEINQLALKLEKQGRTDGRSVASRRKHVNKAWLKGQAHLKTRRENLQLALEVSSFYQQAENALSAMNNTGTTAAGEPGEVRDVAAQIMMLDVSVSQLSNLQPALAAGVARKHGEVKDRWALFRNERSTLAPTGSAFTREDADPLTPAREPQCREGTGTQRIMGKEVKEERNRLKGCVGAVTRGGPPSGQSRERRPGSGASGRAEEVTVGHRPAGGSQKPRAEPRPAAAPQGHPLLHAQLQKFTVSADKTLSWLKDNVSMATQVCSMASLEGLEAARRCQHALEQEILTNRARIEVVKREGRGLVRAQHPGSAKIEEFLSQLEVLWEELRRRHQRNAVFLQASGELGFRVVRVLQALGSLEAWLESVELSMKESALAGDPETMSAAERESSLLEKEVAARGPELGALRQEVDRLDSHAHPHIRGLATRMEELERKYRHVQGALTQQSSVLQDTRMLTEFLERVELEESEELSDGRHGLDQPLHSDISSAPSLLGLRSSSSSAEPLMESMGDPVEELREAVEMLNDTARERGRSQSRDQAIQDLLRDHARLAIRIEERLCRSKELSLDVLERETDMAVRCELDRCGLEALQETQDHLEIDYEVMEEELRETEKRASRLRDLCPERTRVLAKKLQATLQAWAELGAAVAQNRARLREFQQLRDFFRSYLAVISWTEDTRSCIFSEAALYFDKDGQKPLAAELDMQIEHKFEEFDELAVKGRNLLGEEHHLTQMVRERMEELRSMLGWILLHWRAQKQQWLDKKGRQGTPQDNLYSEAIMCSPSLESPDPEQEAYMSHQPLVIPNEDKVTVTGDARPASPPPRQTEEQEEGSLEDGYEVMNSIGPRSAGVPSPDSPKASVVVLNEPGGPASGGAVNLILSFGGKGDSQVQVVEPSAKTDEVVKDAAEPVHRDQSTSLLSVHMGSERGKASRSPEDTETQEGPMAARGRRLSPSGRPELQPMEGTLERKHKLQLGGKKAASRAWASYYAVLHRHTLCFYQDRKDTPRGPACGLPLALIGAECSPAPEYAKKPNCFRLRLHDGSEYLLNASSRFMMKKWMMRIQANTCHGDRVCCTGAALASDEGLHTSSAPSLVPSCHSLARCRCSSRRDATATPPRHQPLAAAQSKEIVVLTRELSHVPQGRLRRLDEQWSISAPHGGCYDDDDDDDEAGTKQTGTPGGDASSPPLSGVKCRSHSFTSATYQRIRPVGQNPGGPEKGSNYCVTLVVGDKASDGGRSCGPPVLVPVRNYMSLPRPPNKSVFKKFFGKRDL
ncbi:spectrin beta chain, non-erythrocytic 2 isoform X6 [Betta splendens]|uniref:Spectrin beta chain, non-erythrocytic 2 isoform X6 n=1 Tax=Betta splendens TaxID=158456 RepID=A0A9W2XAE0_BETSP|nr:spectrin beta chain, non-erythrocytic 2 isoform X6 [Betta splendens]